MENVSSNGSQDRVTSTICEYPPYLIVLTLVDLLPFLVGQPVVAKLLWNTCTSKKAVDTLNFNLALFHYLHYWISIVHLNVMFLVPGFHKDILTFLFVYGQIGGPLSLGFICLERYVAVIYPTSFPLLKKYRFREDCVVSVWLCSLPFAFFRVLSFSQFRENMLDYLPLTWLTGMTIMLVHSSVSIMKALKKSGPGRKGMHPVKKRAFKTVTATLQIVVFCYAPVTVLQRFHFDEALYTCVIVPVCIFLMSAASVVHPLFYLSTQGKVRPCLKRLKKDR